MDDPSLMPDLSHLSAEEREIIEQVFKRQKDEEAKEVQLTQYVLLLFCPPRGFFGNNSVSFHLHIGFHNSDGS